MRGSNGQTRETLLQDFVDWSAAHVTGDEKGQAQIFLDHLFRASKYVLLWNFDEFWVYDFNKDLCPPRLLVC
jgi:hypothetical protein